jgi:hypothetical protein
VSAQVPVWVPVLVALLGLAGVILAQVLSTHRESRRWRLEAEREELRWGRERESRAHDARATAYSTVLGAIEPFDMVLYQGMRARESDRAIDEPLAADLREATGEARRALGPANLHAPEAVRTLIPEAMMPRMRLSRLLLDPEGEKSRMRKHWEAGQLAYRVLRAEMRRDLGLDAEDLDAVRARFQ